MASSLGDVVTLGILAGCANLLLVNIGNITNLFQKIMVLLIIFLL